jgi:mono/diheme cytochrome c family protein
MKIIGTIVAVILVEIAVALIVIYAGTFNVSALNQDHGIRRWVLSETMDHSVEHHAKGIQVPPLSDSSLIKVGFNHYHEMCEVCHGGPGSPPGELADGLNPPAPSLVAAASDWSDAELYWIIKNGIKMSGMPAWGPTHSEHDLWALVAFTGKLPNMSPDQYQELVRAAKPMDEEHSHTHEH